MSFFLNLGGDCPILSEIGDPSKVCRPRAWNRKIIEEIVSRLGLAIYNR
jgi:hypothetical protein